MKRVFDLVLVVPALIILAPLLIPVIVVLRLTGEGEVFYRQERVGRNGKPFGLLKFATMLKESPAIGAGLFTEKDDPRILPFGRFLRKSKINELPQLLNIFLGDMSIVGPRPQVKSHFDVFPADVKKEIVSLTPGLTGVGSIVFRNEEQLIQNSGRPYEDFYNNVIAPYKGELELWYKKNQSLLLDIKLVFITAWSVLFSGSNLHRQLLKGLPVPPSELSSMGL